MVSKRKAEAGLIQSKKAGMKTFITRKNGIIKKANELSKLCGVDVAVIIFGPDREKPHVWPQEPQKLNNILLSYQPTDKKLSSNSVFAEKVAQKTDLGKDPLWDNRIDSLSDTQLVGLIEYLDSKLEIVNERIDMLKRGSIQSEEVYVGEKHQPSCSGDDDLKMMMMMMNGSRCCDLPSGYMGDCTGIIGMATSDVSDRHQLSGDDELMKMKMMMMMNDCSNQEYEVDNAAYFSWFCSLQQLLYSNSFRNVILTKRRVVKK